jgi:hypothetical protein
MPKKNSVTKSISRHRAITRHKSQSEKARQRAILVLRRMRKTGASLASASRDEHIDPRTVRRYVGNELKQSSAGRPYRAAKHDRLSRNMLSPTEFGMEPITVRGSREASQLGKYLSAVGEYLRTGTSKALQKFKGKKIGGQALITDLELLRTLAQAGALQLEDIYAATGVA